MAVIFLSQAITKFASGPRSSRSKLDRAWRIAVRDRYLILLVLPAVIYFTLFCYLPMGGTIMAFKDFRIGESIFESKWVGFRWFQEFFASPYFVRNIRNTLVLSFSLLVFSFPAPIILALLLNELRNKFYKSFVQTVSYLPYFVSLVVVVGILTNFLSVKDGIVNIALSRLGIEPIDFMASSEWFRPVYILSDIWQTCGWSSIIYLASLAAIDPQMYEAAYMDGANRWQRVIHVTLPGITSTIVMLLILRVGSIMSVGFDKILLMYKPITYEVSDVIQTFVYRRGLIDMQYSFASAVGLFNSAVNFILIMTVNKISRKVTQIGLW
jgi:putative aldouronate transport system permease protein